MLRLVKYTKRLYSHQKITDPKIISRLKDLPELKHKTYNDDKVHRLITQVSCLERDVIELNRKLIIYKKVNSSLFTIYIFILFCIWFFDEISIKN